MLRSLVLQDPQDPEVTLETGVQRVTKAHLETLAFEVYSNLFLTSTFINSPICLSGDFGDKGDLGEPGRPPFSAPPGLRGDRGYPGLQGPQGKTGYTGSKGPKGEGGEIGRRGRQGIQGIKGETGNQGLKGFPGPPGYPSRSIRGPKGDMGETGTPGRAGVPGEPGRPGLQGAPGSPGLDDTTGRCPCNAIDAATLAELLSAPLSTSNGVMSYYFATLAFTIDSVPSSSPVVSFGNLLVNDGGTYDAGSGIFTAPGAGIYQFLLSIMPEQGTTASVVMRRLAVNSNVAYDVETYTCISGPRLASVLGPADPVIPFATQQMLQLDQGDK